MSFTEIYAKQLNETVKKYVQLLAEKYSLDEAELFALWTGGIAPAKKAVSSSNEDKKLSTLSKNELIALCKENKVKTTGTKAEMIERLEKIIKPEISSAKEETPMASQNNLLKKIAASIPTFSISRNRFGNYEHAETSLVFDNKTKKVYGRQNPSGKIDPLTEDDFDICNKYKLEYTLTEETLARDDEEEDEEEETLNEDQLLGVEDSEEEIEEEEEEYEYE